MADKKLNLYVLKNTLPYFVKLDIKSINIYIYMHVCIYTEVILSINV